MAGSVVAKQRNRSAIGPPVIQTLRPLSTQRSPRRSARVCMLKMSEPASGSLAPLAPKSVPSHRPGQPPALLLVGAEGEDRHRDGPERGVQGEDQAGVGAAVAQRPPWRRPSWGRRPPGRRTRRAPAARGCRTGRIARNPPARTRPPSRLRLGDPPPASSAAANLAVASYHALALGQLVAHPSDLLPGPRVAVPGC